MYLDVEMLLRHLWVTGMTGAGKSSAYCFWILGLLKLGYPIGLIDPNNDLVTDVVDQLAMLPRKRWEQVIVWNVRNTVNAIGLNVVELKPGEDAATKFSFLASVIAKIFAADPLITARMQRIMMFTFWLLSRFNLTLVEFPKVLTDKDFRKQLVALLDDDEYELKDYWLYEFTDNPKQATDWSQSSLNKIGAMTANRSLKRILGQPRSTIDFRMLMDEEISLLVALCIGALGELGKLFGAFVLALIQWAAFSREDTFKEERKQWILFVDEFQNVLTDDIERILSQGRKYGLGVVLANQHFAQLEDFPKLQSAVINTILNRAIFRTGYKDAELLAPGMFIPELDQVKDIHIRKNPTGISFWPYETVEDKVWRPLEESWERERRKLTVGLEDREFYFNQMGRGKATKHRIPGLPPVRRTAKQQNAVKELLAQSDERCATPVAQVDEMIQARRRAINDGSFFAQWEDPRGYT